MNITADTALQIDKCYQTYLSLTEYEQTVLKVLAMVDRSIGVTKLNTLLVSVVEADCFSLGGRIRGLKVEHREQLTRLCIKEDSYQSVNRQQLLDELEPFDCVIISYGLLQRESQLLSKVQWRTIVADQAQALKNPMAKRTQAACAFKEYFKIITTGTPIENNLTELWSLFRFSTPGWLGSLKGFIERHGLPIGNVNEDKLAARKASLLGIDS
ncbi:SNF2-related protein [Marinagarivorans algicola]|uniref:SNF2-related protein n=1 Tax=Marinagarivorans algicola TaxID=1513270 RepID=UPI0006B40C54|nr:SNF2-related protein [Marinagarivorans algicola]